MGVAGHGTPEILPKRALEAFAGDVILAIIGGLGVVVGLLRLPPSSIRLPRWTTKGVDRMAARIGGDSDSERQDWISFREKHPLQPLVIKRTRGNGEEWVDPSDPLFPAVTN